MARTRGRAEGDFFLAALSRFCRQHHVAITGFGRAVVVYDEEGAEIANFRRVGEHGGFEELELGRLYGGPNPLTGIPDE